MSSLTPQEHLNRRHRLTGSSWAAYLGYSPWASPEQAWEIDQGLSEFEGNDLTEAGEDLEDGIANMVARALGRIFSTEVHLVKPSTVFHPDFPEMVCVHPDRLWMGGKLGIQIKNHLPWLLRGTAYKGRPISPENPRATGGPYDNELVPPYYNIQCQVESMTVAAHFGDEAWGRDWLLASYFGGNTLRLYWIHRDTLLRKGLLHAGRLFWARHLDPNGPQERPVDAKWHAEKHKPQPPKPIQKTSTADILAAPLPTFT